MSRDVLGRGLSKDSCRTYATKHDTWTEIRRAGKTIHHPVSVPVRNQRDLKPMLALDSGARAELCARDKPLSHGVMEFMTPRSRSSGPRPLQIPAWEATARPYSGRSKNAHNCWLHKKRPEMSSQQHTRRRKPEPKRMNNGQANDTGSRAPPSRTAFPSSPP